MSNASFCVINVESGQHAVGRPSELEEAGFFPPEVISDVTLQAITLPEDPNAPLVMVNSGIAHRRCG
jgi:hypothetical protein